MSESRSPASPQESSSPKGMNKRVKKPAFPLQIPPEDLEKQDEDLIEKLKEEAKSGLPGLGVSLGIHILILVVMWIIVKQKSSNDPLVLLGSWTTIDTRQMAQEGDDERQRNLAPIAINTKTGTVPIPAKVNTPQTEKKPESEFQGNAANVDQLLKNRNLRMRDQIREEVGANKDAERAVQNGLRWLAGVQQSAGNWKLQDGEGYPDGGLQHLRSDTGATSLALLCFLGDGHTHLTGDYTTVVRKGLDWLIGTQQDNGNFNEFTELGRQVSFYAHSQATIVMCEAYAMTGDDTLREPAERGVQYLVECQQPVKGGWKYQPQDIESHGDLSVTGWGLMALHTARAAGIEVPETALELGWKFLNSVQEEEGALYKYEERDPPERCSPALTAEGLLCRQFLGWPKDHPALNNGIDWLKQPRFRPEWEVGKRNVYHWYYATSLFHNMGGDEWQIWYTQVMQEIIDHQVPAGKEIRGSWSPYVAVKRGVKEYGERHEYADAGGRLYITCLCILTLEAPYRHAPLYPED